MTQKARHQPHRWFIYSSAGLFVLLSLSIIFAAMILLRRGYVARRGVVTGSSMEPTLRGPRLKLKCVHCEQTASFAWDTCRSGRPFPCPHCNDPDMVPDLDLEELVSTKGEMSPGEQIDYGPLRMIRALRAKNQPSSEMHPTGICRGDLVVFQDPASSTREIKRLVGFPKEKISIQHGDLFVNGSLHKKSIPDLLNQAVLLSRWDHLDLDRDPRWKIRGQGMKGNIDFFGDNQRNQPSLSIGFSHEPPRWIDNQLAVNAHDSHRIFSVSDVGIAIQLESMHEEFTVNTTIANPRGPVEVTLLCNDIQWEIHGNGISSKVPRPANQSCVWCVIAICDGDLVVGCETAEWFRTTLSNESQNEQTEPPPQQLVTCEFSTSKLQITQFLVFRDLYYRGAYDSDSQVWEAGEHVVVLGDNVSCSSDSRDRWENGLDMSTIKGVVARAKNPLENLLHQSQQTRNTSE